MKQIIAHQPLWQEQAGHRDLHQIAKCYTPIYLDCHKDYCDLGFSIRDSLESILPNLISWSLCTDRMKKRHWARLLCNEHSSRSEQDFLMRRQTCQWTYVLDRKLTSDTTMGQQYPRQNFSNLANPHPTMPPLYATTTVGTIPKTSLAVTHTHTF